VRSRRRRRRRRRGKKMEEAEGMGRAYSRMQLR